MGQRQSWSRGQVLALTVIAAAFAGFVFGHWVGANHRLTPTDDFPNVLGVIYAVGAAVIVCVVFAVSTASDRAVRRAAASGLVVGVGAAVFCGVKMSFYGDWDPREPYWLVFAWLILGLVLGGSPWLWKANRAVVRGAGIGAFLGCVLPAVLAAVDFSDASRDLEEGGSFALLTLAALFFAAIGAAVGAAVAATFD